MEKKNTGKACWQLQNFDFHRKKIKQGALTSSVVPRVLCTPTHIKGKRYGVLVSSTSSTRPSFRGSRLNILYPFPVTHLEPSKR